MRWIFKTTRQQIWKDRYFREITIPAGIVLILLFFFLNISCLIIVSVNGSTLVKRDPSVIFWILRSRDEGRESNSVTVSLSQPLCPLIVSICQLQRLDPLPRNDSSLIEIALEISVTFIVEY